MPLLQSLQMKPHLEVSERYLNVGGECCILVWPHSLPSLAASDIRQCYRDRERDRTQSPRSVRSLPGASLDWASDIQDA